MVSSLARRRAAALAALGHELRWRILHELLAAYPAGLVVGRLRQLTRVPLSTLSHHLHVLEREGLVERRREGRFLRYRAAPQSLLGLLEALGAEFAALGAPAATDTGPGGAGPLYD